MKRPAERLELVYSLQPFISPFNPAICSSRWERSLVVTTKPRVRSLQGNLRPRPCCIDRAISAEINELFMKWPFHYGPGQRISFKKHVTSMSCTLEPALVRWHWSADIPFDNCQWTITWSPGSDFSWVLKCVVEYYSLLCTDSVVFFCLPLAILHYLLVNA